MRGTDPDTARAFEADLRAAGNIARLTFAYAPGDSLTAEVTLAEAVTS